MDENGPFAYYSLSLDDFPWLCESGGMVPTRSIQVGWRAFNADSCRLQEWEAFLRGRWLSAAGMPPLFNGLV